jgi:NADPH:quinone reductase-like Zn-dependent oxidoreductase
VLVRVHATTVSAADWRVRSLMMPRGFGVIGRLALGPFRPRQPILGTELAGDVVDVGRSVTRFKPGDRVFAFTGAAMGAYVEYKCLPEDGPFAPIPPNLDYVQAAALSFGGATMLDFFRRAALRRSERVLVNGASGAVGTAAVQLARHFGAHVTAVCSAANHDLVRGLGAEHLIDYAREDFARSSARFDVIVDIAGTAPFARSHAVLAKGGRLLLVLASLQELLLAPWHSWTSGLKVIGGPAAERNEYLHELSALASAGCFRPVIDRVYPLDRIIDAHEYVDRGHKRGNVVVTLNDRQGA